MKLTFLLVFVAALQVSAHVNGQGKVSLKLNEVEISKALNSIEKQGTYRFLYNSRLAEISRKISIDVSNSEIKAVLDHLLSGTELTYKILENNLIVVLAADQPQQDIKITGKITGDNGEPLSNVTVQVKGSDRGTTTDFSGNFTLLVPDNATLTISYIGYNPQEVAVSGQSVFNIKMVPSNRTLDQVVVVGYGTQRKIDVTGSVGQIKGDELAKQASPNPISGLQGKIAGVQITNVGTPGSSPDIKIRGLGTYSSNASPLYVVDGVWVTDVSFLNPADIDNVSILKDASSSAIYGVKGANGVVLITTKKGRGKAVVSYNGTVGWQVATHIPKMADAHEYAIMFNELARATGGTNFLDSSQFGTGTKWFNQALRNALITNHQIGVSGGTEKSTYNLSLGFLDQQGILKTNDYKRYTVTFNNDVQVSRFVKAGYTIIGDYSKSHDAPNGIWRDLYTAPPVLPVKFANGRYGDPGYYGLGQSVSNPQVTLDYNYATTKSYHVNGNAYIEIKFLDHFTLHSSAGGIYQQDEQQGFTPIYNATATQSSTHNTLTEANLETRNWIIENTLTYANQWGDHKVTALAGQTAYRNWYDEVHATAQDGSITSNPNTWFLGNGVGNSANNVYDITPANAPPQAYPALERVSSYFGRVTYSFADRYTVTGTLRSDGDSKFTAAHGRALLPSVGAAWVVSNESFMKGQHVFSYLKLKGSWGRVGNSGVPVYVATQTNYLGGNVIYNNTGTISSASSVASPVPPVLNWEKSEGTDGGFEATLLNNHLNIEADYYNRNTLNFIFPVLFGGATGFQITSLPENVGKLRNRGVEFSATWRQNINKDFSFSIGGNIAYNQNRFVQNTAGGQKLYSGGGAATGGQLGTVTTVGDPLGEFYGYKVIGIFQTDAEVNSYVDKNGVVYQPSAKAGDFKYAKTSNGGLGAIGGNDRVNLGNPNPRYLYGINTSWAYKAFDLAVDFNGVAGVQLYNANKGLRYGNENWTQDFYNSRWHGAGTSNTNPSVNIGGNTNYYINSYYVESGAYFRIRNVQLGYTLPGDYASKIGIKKVRIYVNAQNPAIFTKYKGFTPEVGGTPGNIGIDNNVYPVSAIYNCGLNVTF